MKIRNATERIASKHDVSDAADLLYRAAYTTDETPAARELRNELNASDVSDEAVDETIVELDPTCVED
jgi:hypothetical protein